MNSIRFSHEERKKNLERLSQERFDLLIIGGGITGAAVARDASYRGMKVALVEKNDFASGTSCASSKLIHGGLRYLEQLEFSLVFEALSERAHLLKTSPHMVKPLPFYLPVYEKDRNGMGILSMGLWLYDLLSLFSAPKFHKRMTRDKFLREIPFINKTNLRGGFRYFDASMWDDVLVIENLRAAALEGACSVNEVEALSPYFEGEQIKGFTAQAREQKNPFLIKADRVAVCVGPWTDKVGETLSKEWKAKLKPSQGIHLVFKKERLPLPGAMVMSQPTDERIAFVIPRNDFGNGVVIVGTTDTPIRTSPEEVKPEKEEIDYLMGLLKKYFPEQALTEKDIVSAYVGVRPLVNDGAGSLAKVSREHTIDEGPGGVTWVAGGKYTTHRLMAEEIVDFVLRSSDSFQKFLHKKKTSLPVNAEALRDVNESAPEEVKKLSHIYGGEAELIWSYQKEVAGELKVEGFTALEGQALFWLRHGMVLSLSDFIFRRVPLFLCLGKEAISLLEPLSQLFRKELSLSEDERVTQVSVAEKEIDRRLASIA